MRHVLINLLKNAEEASEARFEASLRIDTGDDGSTYIQALDRAAAGTRRR